MGLEVDQPEYDSDIFSFVFSYSVPANDADALAARQCVETEYQPSSNMWAAVNSAEIDRINAEFDADVLACLQAAGFDVPD